jgi:hypothetical protein
MYDYRQRHKQDGMDHLLLCRSDWFIARYLADGIDNHGRLAAAG